MVVELFLAVVAESSMLANLTHTDIVLLHAHTTHACTRTHTHTHTHTHVLLFYFDLCIIQFFDAHI